MLSSAAKSDLSSGSTLALAQQAPEQLVEESGYDGDIEAVNVEVKTLLCFS